MKASGWAAIRENKILVRTVSDTRKAAVINYLVVYHGVSIYNSMKDSKIESLLEEVKGDDFIHEVTIELDSP